MVKRHEDWKLSHLILVLLAAAVIVRISDLGAGAGYVHGVFHGDRRECCSSIRTGTTCSTEGADGAAHMIL
jgi:hypothetical protein